MPLPHVHTHHRSSLSNKSSDYETEDETIVEPDQGNVLSHIISQLRPGADLSRVTLPTFILEPRSMLERITNFMAHPETLLPMPTIDDPLERFVSVVRFYLSGWHIKPPGVKKPLNPILGETFTCYWDYNDGTRGYYISEQTSHHPPKSSYFFMAPEHHIRIDGTLKPRSKFLGNSAASLMEGTAVLTFLDRGKNPAKGERYHLTQPNMYARGILFGKMKYELGDHSFIKCPENHFVCDVEFKTKGYFSGTYNAIAGTIKNDQTGEVYYELSGLWNGEMYLKNNATGKKDLLFDATHAKHTPPLVRSLEDQTERESQKLWYSTVQGLNARNHEVATAEKTKIEDQQREEAAKRAEGNVEWHPKLFRRVRGGPGGSEEGEEDLDWIINAEIDGKDVQKAHKQILAIAAIIPGQKAFTEFHTPTNKLAISSTSLESYAQSHGGDLIDLGNEMTSTSGAAAAKPAHGSSHDLLGNDTSSGLMAPLQPVSQTSHDRHPVKRVDSTTNDVDVFVDAEEQ
ncbi:Oxysterol-binding protein OBPa [Talaromyces marneffei ATCC 18224]|uniref:Oxysterol binding protein (Osh7), putative n=1 Tax=Talaromyces marneffei (strain ATCC 18224 / CBS 334.59 / QM 7333) TaxID=441960 RepID=B6QP00_TALMQ|nr:uncharacterized protein EYB26_003461 [Talaromyces marneffei]EEA20921.1 oxysterol binding protein (Osh7), putative [Talaromyces marneffei ATCC 18224]KAE8549875.1 hypothetical protein EYB25_008399 [Talaromyces marneffei]QGA15801.1 hypothetical protein EYB26_003461 [Talaromyces marneffei]